MHRTLRAGAGAALVLVCAVCLGGAAPPAGSPEQSCTNQSPRRLDAIHLDSEKSIVAPGVDDTLFYTPREGGDAVKLAADRARVATMIRSAGEGFRALTSKGVAVQPRPLRMIFTVVPRMFAVRYWQGQLRGTVGTVALAPHSKMTKDTELPVLYRDVQKLVGGTVPTPHLDKLLSLTPLLCLAASRAFSMVTSRGIRNDSLNRKRILQIGLVLFALTLLAAALSTSGLA